MEAEANLRDAQIQLSYTEIKSPISGRIGRAAGVARQLGRAGHRRARDCRSRQPDARALLGDAARDAGGRATPRSTGKLRARVRLADGRLYNEKGRSISSTSRSIPRPTARSSARPSPTRTTCSTDGQTVRVIIEEKGGDKVVVIPQSADRARPDRALPLHRGDDKKVEQRRAQDRHRPRGPGSSTKG